MTYPMRCYNKESDETYVSYLTIDEIVENTEELQINMIDVGIVLLNRERDARCLIHIPPHAIAGYDGHLGLPDPDELDCLIKQNQANFGEVFELPGWLNKILRFGRGPK